MKIVLFESAEIFFQAARVFIDFDKESIVKSDLFPFVPPPPPPQYDMLPPITEHVSLHVKSLCKNMASASGRGAPSIICTL